MKNSMDRCFAIINLFLQAAIAAFVTAISRRRLPEINL